MKQIYKIVLCLLVFSLVLPLAQGAADSGTPKKEIMILFTHDLHSYLLPHRVLTKDGNQIPLGGYARLAQVIQEQRNLYPNNLILVDAGDFSMGTLFHTAFPKEAFEFRLMGKMGYDAVTLGNHDFDFHNDGLARMLQVAREKKGPLPPLIASNVLFSQNLPGDATLKQAFQSHPVKEYLILEKNGLRLGLFGLIGKDAADDTPFAKPLTFADPIPVAKRLVDILKNKEKVDLVICLSHSGTWAVKKKSEDEVLAREVPQIDVIISGHTHTILPEPIKVGKTIIVSAGRYGERLGLLRVNYSQGKGIELLSYDLKNITAQIEEEKNIAADIETFKKTVERDYLSLYGLTFDQVLAESAFDMESLTSAYARPREMGLGNMITDAFRQAVQKAEGKDYDYIHLALDPLGLIRGSLQKGKITVSDAFQVLSLGLGHDGRAGYPLMAFYVFGREIKDILEVETTVAPMMKTGAHLQVSGVKFTFNPYRVWFDRVTSTEIQEPDGSYKALDPNRLYRVCTNLYTTKMIDYIGKASHGILKVTPKDKNGRPLPDLKQAIVYIDKKGSTTEELKEWIALAQYLGSFKDTNGNGIPDLPERYRGPEGRYQAVASLNPVNLIGGGSFITYGVLVIGLLLAVLVFFFVRLGLRKIKPSGKIR